MRRQFSSGGERAFHGGPGCGWQGQPCKAVSTQSLGEGEGCKQNLGLSRLLENGSFAG